MLVLVAYESSHEVSRAFRLMGHTAYSCDILPPDMPNRDGEWHIQGDALMAIRAGQPGTGKKWDLVIAHPPCTYLCSSGLHWNTRMDAEGNLLKPGRAECTEEAKTHFMALVNLLNEIGCKWCIENPVGCMSKAYRRPDQFIQPYEFGDDASKKTGLWLRHLPRLKLLPKEERAQPRRVMYQGKLRERWSNQTDSGQNRLPPTAKRWQERSKTYPGIAKAMAEQWGDDTRGVQVTVYGYVF